LPPWLFKENDAFQSPAKKGNKMLQKISKKVAIFDVHYLPYFLMRCEITLIS